MKILAIEKEFPDTTAEQFQNLLKDEARRVWELQQSGQLREIYFNSKEHTAVLILECPDLDEARRLLSTLPLVRTGLILFDLISLVPYDGFARLFT
jgi:muconolactone delta-isomerase